MKEMVKRAVAFIKDTDVDIRIRLMFLVEYAALCTCLIGTITMLLFTTSIYMVIPNIVLFIFCIVGLLLSHYRQKYELAAILFTIGCAYISLPFMFFTAGGNKSGMIIWFLFGSVFCCVISKGKARVIMPVIMIVISAICMLIGYYHPETVISLENDSAVFFDTFQSFIVVSFMLLATLCACLYTYDRQSKMLIEQREELRKMAFMDSLTGIPNRHAYYEAIYKEVNVKKDLVLLAMDVNGLKKVNDTDGHAAGDALIKCAADIMTAAFSKLGTVYRTGGDEFMAIIFCEDSETDKLRGMLDDAIRNSSDEAAEDMSIALGIAAWNEEKDSTFFELERIADSRMYQNKSEYYKNSGVDRRSAKQ